MIVGDLWGWISTEWITRGTRVPKPSLVSLQFKDRDFESEFMVKMNGNSTTYCVFLFILLGLAYCVETIVLKFLMEPRVFSTVAWSFIAPIGGCTAEIMAILYCRRLFVKRWQHAMIIPGLLFALGMLFVYLPYFTDIIEYRRGPVAFAYAFAYLVIFGVSLTPHSYFTAFIVLIPISPMCWLLLSSNIHISPWLLLSTFSLYGTATVVTLVHLRERESRQRRVFALQKEFLTNSFEVDERELLPFLPILQKADLPSAVTSKVIPISSEHTINDIQDPNYDILKNCVSLRDVMTQWILWDLEGNLVNIHSSSIHILSSHFLRLFISHLQGTWNSDWKQCGVEDKYCEWLCSSFLVNFRMRYVFLFFAEIAFAFTDQLACLNEINRRYIMCTRGTLLRNFRIGLAFLSFIGAFLSFLTPINTNLTKLRLANLAIEIPRLSNMAWIDVNDGSGELFACYIISLLLEASSLYPMTLQHYSILHLITMTQALITICIVRKTALVDNVVLFVMLGIVGYLECILSDKELRRLYILERILGARVELFSGLGNREGTSMNGETMA